ncbi:MAG: hypothetical protein GF320_15090, partial [Armatimonadia bacterium]|nr:hypothetical protein [Armatimonadia bacterium]
MAVLLSLLACLTIAPPDLVLDESQGTITNLESPFSGRALAGQGGELAGGVL